MPDGREFVVHVEPASAAASCWFHHVQYGAFGASGSGDGRPISGGAFAIRTGIGDKPAKSLKVAVWCRGLGMALLDISALESSGYEQTLSLLPLKPIPLAGRALPSSDGVSLSNAELRVLYVAPWLCTFFNLMDCGVPQWNVATGRIATDGTFQVVVPDFAADPVIKKWASEPAILSGPGVFRLRADRSAAPYNYWLELDRNAAFGGAVPVAAAYPEMLFRPRRN
jgi:hypothetical protein